MQISVFFENLFDVSLLYLVFLPLKCWECLEITVNDFVAHANKSEQQLERLLRNVQHQSVSLWQFNTIINNFSRIIKSDTMDAFHYAIYRSIFAIITFRPFIYRWLHFNIHECSSKYAAQLKGWVHLTVRWMSWCNF